jgi:hypothetical protein
MVKDFGVCRKEKALLEGKRSNLYYAEHDQKVYAFSVCRCHLRKREELLSVL